VKALLGALVLLTAAGAAEAQSLLLDRGRQAAGLWCFPLADRPKEWQYLPGRARVASDEKGRLEFSFLRYAKHRDTVAGEPDSRGISEADGGAVLHLLALYDTDSRQVERAQAELRRALEDDEVRLAGPVPFGGARYAVVSSILAEDAKAGASPVRRLLQAGSAPLLEGQRIPLSFSLEAAKAELLRQSLSMPSADLSLSFDLEFSGLTDPYDATLEVDWTLVHKSQKISAAVNIYVVGAEVKVAVEELVRNGAIKVSSRGDQAPIEALHNAAYGKVVDLLFAPIRDADPAPSSGAGALEALSSAQGMAGGSWFGLHGSYQLKDLHSSGKTTISLDHQSAARRHALLTANVGPLCTRAAEACRTVTLGEDAATQQRTVSVIVDGALVPEFQKLVNAVTVSFRKARPDGTFATSMGGNGGDRVGFRYARGGEEAASWLHYEYRTHWSFQGGGSYDTPWTATDDGVVGLFAPYQRRRLEIIGDPAVLRARRISHAVVRVSYPFFGAERAEQVTCRVTDAAIDTGLDVTLPLNTFATRVTVSWYAPGAAPLVSSREDSSGIVFLDDLPSGG